MRKSIFIFCALLLVISFSLIISCKDSATQKGACVGKGLAVNPNEASVVYTTKSYSVCMQVDAANKNDYCSSTGFKWTTVPKFVSDKSCAEMGYRVSIPCPWGCNIRFYYIMDEINKNPESFKGEGGEILKLKNI